MESDGTCTRTVTVLLTRYYGAMANFIYVISGQGYTHASISLDENEDYYYSFNYKGFRREYPKRHRQRVKLGKSVCFKFDIPEEGYQRMKAEIERMEKQAEEYRYSKIGVFLCMLRIPMDRDKKYFCSQFVASMLSLSGAVELKKKTSLYFPNHLFKELREQHYLREVICNPI